MSQWVNSEKKRKESDSVYKTVQCEISDSEVVQLICKEGLCFRKPDWLDMRVARRKPSILILADAQLKFWPGKDSVCSVIYHKNWPLRRWNQAVRLGLIKIDCFTVVLYLEGTRSWQDIPPSKIL